MDLIFETLKNILAGFSVVVPFLQMVGLIISIVLLWYIFFYIKKLNVLKTKIEKSLDKYQLKDVGKRRLRKSWLKVEKLIASGKIDKTKEAITEADKILAELVKLKGVPGKSLNERIENMLEYHGEDAEKIRQARETAKRITDKEVFELSYQEAIKIVMIYKEALKKVSRMSF